MYKYKKVMYMHSNSLRYKREYFTTYQYNGADGYVSIPHLYRLMQETASLQLYEYYDSLESLKEKGLAYILSRIDVKFKKQVGSYEKIFIESWGRASSAVTLTRNYMISDAKKNIIAEATSVWAFLDLEKRKVIRTTEIPHPVKECTDDVDCDVMSRISVPENQELIGKKTVMKSDIDLYGHMNNSKYIDLVCDFAPVGEKRISELKIFFRKECREGEELSVLCGECGGKLVISGIKSDGERSFDCELTLE